MARCTQPCVVFIHTNMRHAGHFFIYKPEKLPLARLRLACAAIVAKHRFSGASFFKPLCMRTARAECGLCMQSMQLPQSATSPLALPNPAQPCACICCMACKNPFQNPNRLAAAARCRLNFEMNTFKPCPILKGQTKPVQAPIAVNRTAFCPIPPAPAPALWPAAPQCARLRPADRSSPAEWHAPPPRQ